MIGKRAVAILGLIVGAGLALALPATQASAAPTPATVATPASPTAAVHHSSRRARVLLLTNVQRATHGLAPLTLSPQLATSAIGYAQQLAADGRFTHTDGGTLAQRVTEAGFRETWIGENLGLGQRSAKQIVTAWMNSPDHRANLLNADFTEAGVGVATRADGQIIWCIDFGGPAHAKS